MIRRFLRSLIAVGLVAMNVFASEQHGEVTFGGLPVPGATVSATQGEKKITAVTDFQGAYSFPDLTDGVWSIQVEMLGFATVKGDVTAAPGASGAKWELKMLPLDQIKAEAETKTKAIVPPASIVAPEAKSEPPKPQDSKVPEIKSSQEDLNQSASDGLLINGSVNNGAASPFAQIAAFGNNRNGAKGLYTG